MTKHIQEREHAGLIRHALSLNTDRGLCIALIGATGARANEILRIGVNDIRLVNDSGLGGESIFLKITASKMGKDRWIPLPDYFLARVKGLRERLAERESCQLGWLLGSGQSLSSSYAVIRRDFAAMQVGLWGEQKYTLHAFRHTVAVLAIKSGMDIVKVKTLLGHRNIQNTMIYLAAYEESLTLDELPGLIPM